MPVSPAFPTGGCIQAPVLVSHKVLYGPSSFWAGKAALCGTEPQLSVLWRTCRSFALELSFGLF